MHLQDGATIRVRGGGGAIFAMDVPKAGTVRREVFDGQIDKGELVVLDTEPEDDVPTFTHKDTGRSLDVAETASGPFRANDDFSEVPEDVDRPDVVDRPSPTALKSAWVEWADLLGHDTDGLTKADLMELE